MAISCDSVFGSQAFADGAELINPLTIFIAHQTELSNGIRKASIRTHLKHFKRNALNCTWDNGFDIILWENCRRNPADGVRFLPISRTTMSYCVIMDIAIQKLIGTIILILGDSLTFGKRGKPLFRKQPEPDLEKALLISDRVSLFFFGIFQSKCINCAVSSTVTICNIKLQACVTDRLFPQRILRCRQNKRLFIIFPGECCARI